MNLKKWQIVQTPPPNISMIIHVCYFLHFLSLVDFEQQLDMKPS